MGYKPKRRGASFLYRLNHITYQQILSNLLNYWNFGGLTFEEKLNNDAKAADFKKKKREAGNK